MAYIFDTCAMSELVEPRPHLAARDRILQLPREEIFLSAITIGEIQNGIDLLERGGKRDYLQKWLEEHVLPVYAEVTLPVDSQVARVWGVLTAQMRRRGFKMQVKDSLIAATALFYGLTVVTRNESDFAHAGVQILNPWK